MYASIQAFSTVFVLDNDKSELWPSGHNGYYFQSIKEGSDLT